MFKKIVATVLALAFVASAAPTVSAKSNAQPKEISIYAFNYEITETYTVPDFINEMRRKGYEISEESIKDFYLEMTFTGPEKNVRYISRSNDYEIIVLKIIEN